MKRGLALLALLLVAGSAGWLLRGAPQDATRPQAIDLAPAAAASSARDESPAPRKTVAARANAPLPPENMPLRDAFPQLDAQARAGNAHAACRVAAELRRCALVGSLIEDAEPIEQTLDRLYASDAEPATLRRQVEQAQQLDARLQAVAAHCAHWEAGPDPRHYLLIAARQGHGPSIHHYLGMALGGAEVLRDPQLAIDYRANGLPLFRRALAAGDMRMLGLWINALEQPDTTPLSAVLPEEWRDGGLLKELVALVHARFGQSATRGTFREPGRFVSSEADRAEAARLFDQWFGDAPQPVNLLSPGVFDGIDNEYFGCRELAR